MREGGNAIDAAIARRCPKVVGLQQTVLFRMFCDCVGNKDTMYGLNSLAVHLWKFQSKN